MGLNIPMTIDRDSDEPLRTQIVRQVRTAIETGLLKPGDPVPSSRALALALGISRSTVVSALLELDGEGWTESTHGSGTFVSDRHMADVTAQPRSAREPRPEPSTADIDMRPGDLSPGDVSMASWRAAWRTVEPSSAPPPPAGTAELREALSTYLGFSRGLLCTPDQIVVCAGTAEALVVLALALRWRNSAVAVEDPGYPAIRRTLATLGVSWVPLDVSDPARLLPNLRSLGTPVAGAYLTPSHQYPLGHRIAPETRLRILTWARETGAVVLEDDYDSEFRFGVAPLPALAGLDTDANTVYIGSMSKVLDPGLRLTYLRVAPHLLAPVLDVREALGATVSAPVQHAITHLLRNGELSRHIARVRKLYQDRRRVLLQALSAIAAITAVGGIEAGLHVVAQLRPGIAAAEAVDQARDRGIRIANLDEFRAQPETGNPALVLGYGRLMPATIRQAIAVLATLPALQ